MILVDTSVWVEHLRGGHPALAELLGAGQVLVHPFVIGEIACGSLARRRATLELLHDLPASPLADPDEVLRYVERHALHGQGIGYVDVHLLAATALGDGVRLWTLDQRLDGAATALGLAYRAAAAH